MRKMGSIDIGAKRMDVKVDRKMLLDALSKASFVIERKSVLPVLLSADTEGLKLRATDLESFLTIGMGAEVLKPGSIAAPFANLNRFAKSLKGEVRLTEEENDWLKVSGGNAVFNLACIPADKFPVPIGMQDMPMAEVSGSLLADMIDRTAYAMDVEESHGGFRLNGILIERNKKDSLRMVATDGGRLSMVDRQVSGVSRLDLGKGGAVVPRKGILLLRRLLIDGKKVRKGLGLADPISLGIGSDHLVVKRKGISLLVRLMDCKFPDYRDMLIREKAKKGYLIEVNRLVLLEAMERIMEVISNQYQGVKITTGADYLEMVSVNPDLGDVEEKIEIKYDGELIEIGFNPKYFIGVLQTMDSDVIFLDIKDQTSPCLITGERDEGFLGLIMPMRV